MKEKVMSLERWSDDGYWMYKDPNGEWVKADIAEEMYAALRNIIKETDADDAKDWMKIKNIQAIAEWAIQKARGE